jgi:hypothetical protein
LLGGEKVSIPIKPDNIIMQLLIRAKAFQDHAIGHANSQTSMDRMIAIHNLDNSIEYILRIVIKHLEIEEKTGKNLDTAELSSLAGETNKFLKEYYSVELPYLNEIKLLRQVRNLVQHAMVDPIADLPRHITIAQRFFEKILNKVFGLIISEIKISSMIEDDLLKGLLKSAEKYIAEKKFIEAVVACRDAFENYVLFTSTESFNKIRLVPALIETKKGFFSLYNYLKHSHFEGELTKLGIETRLYKRFDDYLRHIPSDYCVESHGYTIMQREWNQDDAIFCYSFVSDLIYKWEAGKLSPIYEIQMEEEYKHEEFINGLEINGLPGMGAMYGMGDSYIEYFILDNQDTIKSIREKIKENKSYTHHKVVYENGQKTHDNTSSILVTFVDVSLVTNNPPRWELILQYKDEE